MTTDTVLVQPTDKILTRVDGADGQVIFNNPKRHNAVSLEMWDAMEQALAAFAEDDTVRVTVLSGAGGKAFVSGADISNFETERGSKEANERDDTRLRAVCHAIENYPKPTIAMIKGHCIGGGLNLAACTDMRIASAKSFFGMPTVKLSPGYPFDAIRRLVDAAGAAAAGQLMFMVRPIDAETALRIGLVQEVVAEDALEERVAALADAVAGDAPLTIWAMKYVATQVTQTDPSARDLVRCEAMVADCFASEDYVEGRRFFMERRKPDFKGR
ncbi:MAG: enoyl-CoA hydratase [Boseongicola sp. SB0677_bin_26]|nr:enoyl-CoA hydratase [Boseongicola sp. SB0665_bin_10]MYG26867.1 enoyl-CoA hydratase [Boseongicola sp. SB0677_bin_26]